MKHWTCDYFKAEFIIYRINKNKSVMYTVQGAFIMGNSADDVEYDFEIFIEN